MTTFKDIEIIDLDTERSLATLNITYKQINVYFELSKEPPEEWKDLFRKTRFQFGFPDVSGKYIILKMGTGVEVLERAAEYRKILDDNVAHTNRKYRQHIEHLTNISATPEADAMSEQEIASLLLLLESKSEQEIARLLLESKSEQQIASLLLESMKSQGSRERKDGVQENDIFLQIVEGVLWAMEQYANARGR